MSEPSNAALVEAVEPQVLNLNNFTNAFQAIAVPPSWTVHDVTKIIGKRPPAYRQGTVQLHDIDGLVGYLMRYSGPETVVYVDSEVQSITAVLDDGLAIGSGGDKATQGRRCDLAFVTMEQDPKFKRWTAFASQPRYQKELIRFIEMNDSNFLKPSGAEMRTLAASLDLKKSTVFKSIEKMNGGARDVTLGYETQTSEVGEIKFPSEIVIKIPVFRHQREGAIPVRVYFELIDNQIQFTLNIPDSNSIVDAAWEQVRKDFTDAMTAANLAAIPVLNGQRPEQPNS